MPARSSASRSFLHLFVLLASGISLGAIACSSSSSSGVTAGSDGGSQGGDDASSGDDGSTSGNDSGSGGFDANGPHAKIRIMTGNLSSGSSQNYDGGEGARIFAGLHADIIMIQEFNVGSNDTDVQNFVTTVCGSGCSYFQEPKVSGVTIPNGIITKFPILNSGIWDDPNTTDREFAWAQIDIPGPVDLWAVSVHLLTSSGGNRTLQANSLVGYIRANVPAGAYYAIGGDFNTDSRSEGAISAFSAIVNTDPPYPVDQANNENTNAPRSHPYDWVVGSPELAAGMVPAQVGANSFPGGLVVDTRVYTPIEDLAPAMTTDSAATNMQHMGVVRDFLVAD